MLQEVPKSAVAWVCVLVRPPVVHDHVEQQIEWGLKGYDIIGVLDRSRQFRSGTMGPEFRKYIKAMSRLNMTSYTQDVKAVRATRNGNASDTESIISLDEDASVTDDDA